MERKPLISCIIIFLNAGKLYFEEAIKSIFAQTYENWELLLVDDGSTDESTEIAKQYARQSPEKVRYLEHEGHQNHGMSAARNLGILHAKGEYISFLDGDDVWVPQKLERYLAIIESQPEAAMVCGSTQYWFSWTGNPKDKQRDYVGLVGESIQKNKLYKPPTLLLLFLRNEADTPCTCSVLIRSKVFDDIGNFEEIFRGMFEDRAFFCKLYLKVPVFVTGECLEKYRRHSNASYYISIKMGQFNPYKPNPAQATFLNWLKDYLSREGVKNIDLWQALQKQLWPYHHPFLFFLKQVKKQMKRNFIKLSRYLGRTLFPHPFRLWLDNLIRLIIIRNSVTYISGSQENNEKDFLDDNLTILCVVRNGELYVRSFIDHYLNLGVKQIVFLDNESIDNTVNIAETYKNVTVVRTKYKNQKYLPTMKQYLVERFARDRPHIFVEIDELLKSVSPLVKREETGS